MKQTFRVNTFETNSSSVHSMVVLSDEELRKWENGEAFVEGGTLYTKEQVLEKYEAYNIKYPGDCRSFEDFIEENGYDSYENWGENYEHDSKTYTTKSGEVIHIECYYGQEY